MEQQTNNIGPSHQPLPAPPRKTTEELRHAATIAIDYLNSTAIWLRKEKTWELENRSEDDQEYIELEAEKVEALAGNLDKIAEALRVMHGYLIGDTAPVPADD